jgi:two-component system, NarL family, response regulator
MTPVSSARAMMITTPPIRLLVVDDHPLFREGLAHTLGAEEGFKIVAQAEDGTTAIDLWESVQPDVTLIDVSMPGMDGIETVRQLRSRHADAKLLMLTSSEDQEDVIAALDAGASGYVTKSIRFVDLVAAVREAHHGGRPLGEAIARKLAARDRSSPLTPRELEVLKLLREGLTFVEIGQRLAITERTARAHVGAIKEKLGAANTAQAVARGFEHGLLPVLPGRGAS